MVYSSSPKVDLSLHIHSCFNEVTAQWGRAVQSFSWLDQSRGLLGESISVAVSQVGAYGSVSQSELHLVVVQRSGCSNWWVFSIEKTALASPRMVVGQIILEISSLDSSLNFSATCAIGYLFYLLLFGVTPTSAQDLKD